MILQITETGNTIAHKWLFLDDIRKNTSYDVKKVAEAIEKKTLYGGYHWIEGIFLKK